MRQLDLGEFDFYWQVAESGFSKLPSLLPFRFEITKSLPFLLRRAVSDADVKTLNYMYTLDANVGYLQESNSLGMAYGEDLILKIDSLRLTSSSSFSRVHTPRVLEIGCGGAAVLRRLATKSMKCFAIDPSPIAVDALNGTDIELITDFFPSQLNGEQFDFLFCADVLEHVADPLDFLTICKDHLLEEGLLLVSVPDCTKSIEIGDVSMALHQHLSYFDATSLKTILEEAGFADVAVETAKYGGSLYGTGIRRSSQIVINSGLGEVPQALGEFFVKASSSIAAVRQEVKRSLSEADSVGIYVPLRGLPYVGGDLELRQSIPELRLFDDTPSWKGKRIQERMAKIENFSQLANRPVEHLYVMSLTFGHTISRKVVDSLGSQVSVKTLSSMLPH